MHVCSIRLETLFLGGLFFHSLFLFIYLFFSLVTGQSSEIWESKRKMLHLCDLVCIGCGDDHCDVPVIFSHHEH